MIQIYFCDRIWASRCMISNRLLDTGSGIWNETQTCSMGEEKMVLDFMLFFLFVGKTVH